MLDVFYIISLIIRNNRCYPQVRMKKKRLREIEVRCSCSLSLLKAALGSDPGLVWPEVLTVSLASGKEGVIISSFLYI